MSAETQTARREVFPQVFFWTAFILLIGLYLFEIFAAVGNWQGMAQIADVLADGLSATGVIWLAVGIAVPALALAAALIVTRKSSRGMKLLVLVLGLTLVAIFKLDLFYLVPTTSYLDDLAI